MPKSPKPKPLTLDARRKQIAANKKTIAAGIKAGKQYAGDPLRMPRGEASVGARPRTPSKSQVSRARSSSGGRK